MEEVMQEDEEAISSGISSLTDAGMVDAGLRHLHQCINKPFKELPVVLCHFMKSTQ